MTNSNSTLNDSIIPAADHQYHWSDHSPTQLGAAPTVAAPVYRNQVLDWENAMLLAAAPTSQHSNNDQASSSIYIDQLAEYKPGIHNLMHADVIAALSSHHSRHYESLLSTNSLNSSSNVTGAITWPGLLNTVSSRNSIIHSAEQHENYVVESALAAPYRSYEGTLNGAAACSIGSYSSLPVAAAGGAVFSGDILGASRASNFGLSSFDQRRLEDILMKRELYTTHDFNSRLGLNLGGRTYFSAADDFAFGRFGKRLRPNSPGCVMQPAPLCQAEGCKADLSMAKHYHRRHKVCEYHSKASTVHIGDQTQRFCQQCSRFHVLSEFDDGKRSCRKRLADHNRRRRKPQSTPSLAIEAIPATAPATANDESKDSQDVAATDADHSLVEVNGETSAGIKALPSHAVDDQPQPAASISPIKEYNSDEATNSNYTQRHASRRSGLLEQSNDPSTGIIMIKGEPAPSITAGDRRPSTASAGVSQVVASLSLGAIETPDLPPRASAGVHHDDVLEAGSAAAQFNSAQSTKSSIKMPWLQASRGSNSQLPVPAVPLININGSKAGEQSSEYPNQYIAATSHDTDQRASLAPGDEGHSSSTWMLKSMVAEPADGVLENARHNMVKPSGNSGGHDLLHLLGNERELSNSNKHNEPTNLGSLAFLDHSLNASYKKSEQTIPFSSLQHQQQHLYYDQGQLPRPPHSGGQSSASIFGSRNHWI